jgi:MOSC domain-containing protein YiiM
VIVESVNVGLPRRVAHEGRTVTTGIYKEPVAGRVMVRATNLEGDRQADLRVHGGADKAVYLYPAEHYPHWRETLAPAELAPGWFGENLTTRGVLEDETWIGDVLRVGEALLEVSQPRVPCAKLAMKAGDPAFGGPFLRSGRSGFYLRVREEGEVGAGDAIVREGRGEGQMSVREMVALLDDSASADDLDRAAALSALALGWRERFANRAIARRRIRSRAG